MPITYGRAKLTLAQKFGKVTEKIKPVKATAVAQTRKATVFGLVDQPAHKAVNKRTSGASRRNPKGIGM